MPSPSPTIERRALTIRNFDHRYGVGRTKTAELINEGVLEVRRVGRRVLIDFDSAEAWYRNLPRSWGAGR